MAPRIGGFGGGLDPFGRGSLGNLGQYDIAAELADLESYQIEVAWGNGKASDEEYLASLRKVVAATDPMTRKREAAENKLNDVVYRIGRSKAEEKGLDALIAFDQSALAGMKVDNVRYRDVKDSLDAELAQRRSRDYGKLVDSYNDGKTSTKSLETWVKRTLSGLTDDDPDFDSWTEVAGDLAERILDERDADVYQGYQQGRIKGPAFLAHIKARRDQFSPDSPKYADWDRKLEDARDNVRDKAQSEKDSAFFNRYELGKVSDKAYLKYLRDRIAGMEPGDPQKGEWQHRLTQAAFSVAEDTLRFAVERGKAPVGRLISFYKGYRSKLHPGSAEWRQITRAIDSLTGRSFGGGGGGGGRGGGRRGGGRSTGGGGAGSAVGVGPKLISSKYTLSNTLGLFSIDPTASRKAIAEAKKFLDFNKQSLGNAVRAGDQVWLFQDPRKPGAVVPGQHPDGSPMLDAKGKPVMVRGSAYLPATNEAYSNLLSVEAANWQGMAEFNLSRGKHGDYVYGLKRAAEALDAARLADGQAREQNWQDWYEATAKAVDGLTKQGQYGEAVALATDLARRLAAETGNPYLDDTRRNVLDSLGEKLARNPLIPRVDPATGNLIEGAISMADLQRGTVTLNAGWHHVLKGNDSGMPDYGPVFDERQDGSWEAEHVTVHTTFGGELVTGEVKRSAAPVASRAHVTTPEGQAIVEIPGSTEMVSFPDEHGRIVRAYSVDGRTWIRPSPGQPAPILQINAALSEARQADGTKQLVDENGEVVFKVGADGTWSPSAAYMEAHRDESLVDWYGAADYRMGIQTRSRATAEGDRAGLIAARSFLGDRSSDTGVFVGGPGQRMMLADTSPSGVVNLTPSLWGVPVMNDPTRRRGDERPLDTGPGAIRRSPTLTTGLVAADERRLGASRPRSASEDIEGRRGAGFATARLPSDTPQRYDGVSVRPRVPSAVQLPPVRKSLPALTPPKALAIPNRATMEGLAPLKKPSPPSLKRKTTKITPPKPKRPSKASLAAADKRRRASTRRKTPPRPKLPPAPRQTYQQRVAEFG